MSENLSEVIGSGDIGITAEFDEPSSGHPGVLSIVPAPRPYAYRRPVGHPLEDDTEHPLRRDSDFNPLK